MKHFFTVIETAVTSVHFRVASASIAAAEKNYDSLFMLTAAFDSTA